MFGRRPWTVLVNGNFDLAALVHAWILRASRYRLRGLIESGHVRHPGNNITPILAEALVKQVSLIANLPIRAVCFGLDKLQLSWAPPLLLRLHCCNNGAPMI